MDKNSTQSDEHLKRALETWKAVPEIPARFQSEVWQRIAAREEARSQSVWNRFREGLFFALGRPQYATALIVVSISLSLGVAHLQAERSNEKNWRQLETRYVNSITPLAALPTSL